MRFIVRTIFDTNSYVHEPECLSFFLSSLSSQVSVSSSKKYLKVTLEVEVIVRAGIDGLSLEDALVSYYRTVLQGSWRS